MPSLLTDHRKLLSGPLLTARSLLLTLCPSVRLSALPISVSQQHQPFGSVGPDALRSPAIFFLFHVQT